MTLSIPKPQNQALIDYRGNDTDWGAFQDGLKGIPKGMDVPMIIGGEEVFSSDKIESIDPSTGEVFCTGQKGTS